MLSRFTDLWIDHILYFLLLFFSATSHPPTILLKLVVVVVGGGNVVFMAVHDFINTIINKNLVVNMLCCYRLKWITWFIIKYLSLIILGYMTSRNIYVHMKIIKMMTKNSLKSVHFKNTVARFSVLSKLWSFSIIHQLTLFWFSSKNNFWSNLTSLNLIPQKLNFLLLSLCQMWQFFVTTYFVSNVLIQVWSFLIWFNSIWWGILTTFVRNISWWNQNRLLFKLVPGGFSDLIH